MSAKFRPATVVRLGWLILIVVLAHLALTIIDSSIAIWVLRSAPELRYGPLETIGEMGDAVWYLVPSAIVAAGGLAGARYAKSQPARAALRWLSEAGAFVFWAVAASGLLTNLLKMLVGRSRPNLLNPETPFSLSPLSVDAGFHSFPSGHANTAFAAALALGFLLPRLRLPLLAMAAVIASTRVLVAVHFLSDVLAGAALAILTTYWLRQLFAGRGWAFGYAPDGTIVPNPPWPQGFQLPAGRAPRAEAVPAQGRDRYAPGEPHAH